MVLRDPVDRAYSNWAHLWADGLETINDFVTACNEEPRRRQAGWAPFWRYLETGLYGRQLQHLLTLFPRSQLHLIRYLELVDAPVETLDGVFRFPGVDEGAVSELPARNVGGYVPPTRYARVLRAAFEWPAQSIGQPDGPVVAHRGAGGAGPVARPSPGGSTTTRAASGDGTGSPVPDVLISVRPSRGRRSSPTGRVGGRRNLPFGPPDRHVLRPTGIVSGGDTIPPRPGPPPDPRTVHQ